MERKNKIIKLLGIILICLAFLLAGNYIVKEFHLYKNNNEELNIFFKQYNNTGNQVNASPIDSYFMVLEIPSINLKKGIYDINDKRNNIDENVTILSNSSLPNMENGILLLAAHSGISLTSYFKDLHKLKLNDTLLIHFLSQLYEYKIVNIYTMDKKCDFYLRDYKKKMLILITCLDNYKYLIIEAQNI